MDKMSEVVDPNRDATDAEAVIADVGTKDIPTTSLQSKKRCRSVKDTSSDERVAATSVSNKNNTSTSNGSNAVAGTDDRNASSSVPSKSKIAKKDGKHTANTSITATASAASSANATVCFICGNGNKLLLCDFPRCNRAYHHICIIKTLPIQPMYDAYSNNAVHDIWYCPCHTCVNCNAFQATDCPVRSMLLPSNLVNNCLTAKSSLLLHHKANGSCSDSNTIIQKKLTACSTCPVAFCIDCETEIVGSSLWGRGSHIFIKSTNDSSSTVVSDVRCTNCLSNDPKYKLARALESIWCSAAGVKVAVPFLRPLLPGILSEFKCSIDGDGSIDLLKLIENIRHLKYASIDEFLLDLNQIQADVSAILEKCSSSGNGNEATALHIETITNAFKAVHDRSLSLIQAALKDAKIDGEQPLVDNDVHMDTADGLVDIFSDRKLFHHSEMDVCTATGSSSSRSSIDFNTVCDTEEEVDRPCSSSILQYWRRECEKVYCIESVGNGDNNDCFRIEGRSLSEWHSYLKEGAKYPWKVGNMLQLNRLKSPHAPTRPSTYVKMRMNPMISATMAASDMINDIEAKKIMLCMTDTNARESVSLLESTYTGNDSALSKALFHADDQKDYLCADESLVVIDRLRDITTRALDLELSMRNQHMICISSVSNVITISEIEAAKELKLSNDNYRWCILQRERALTSSGQLIDDINAAILEINMRIKRESELTIAALKKESDLKNETARLLKEISKMSSSKIH